MSVKSGQVIGPTAIAAADTSILAASAAGVTREVYSATIHNTGAATTTVEVFVSADATSATAERIAYLSLGANEQKDVGQFGIPATYVLIAKASATGLNFYGLYTQRDGSNA